MSAKAKTENLKKALSHGPTRLIFLGGIGLTVMVIVLAYSMLGRGKPQGEGSAQLESVPVPTESTGAQPMNTQAYDQLAAASDAQTAADAKSSGESAMPMPRVGEAEPEVKNDVAVGMPPAEASTAATAPASAEAGQSDAQRHAQAVQEAHDQAVVARYQAMAKQYDQLVARWPGGGGAREPMTIRAPAANESPTAAAAAATQPATAPSAPLLSSSDIRANEAFLGVTISEANTDDPLPLVRARVLNGPAKGAVLLGTIETSERAPGGLVRFNLMTLPDAGESVAIDAVAIDPATSRSSVASSVNRHTVSRMAALFFSSVLGGVAEAMLQGGQQERVVTNGTTTVVQRDAYSDRDLALIGVGKVGVNGAKMVEGAVNRRPTVTLRSGVDVGVLFMKDVTLP